MAEFVLKAPTRPMNRYSAPATTARITAVLTAVGGTRGWVGSSSSGTTGGASRSASPARKPRRGRSDPGVVIAANLPGRTCSSSHFGVDQPTYLRAFMAAKYSLDGLTYIRMIAIRDSAAARMPCHNALVS